MTPFAFGSKVWPGGAKLLEEMAELTVVLCKSLMIGGQTDHWSGQLRPMIIEELADVQAALTFFVRHNLTDAENRAFFERAAQKIVKFETWHAESTPAESP